MGSDTHGETKIAECGFDSDCPTFVEDLRQRRDGVCWNAGISKGGERLLDCIGKPKDAAIELI